MTNQVVTPTPSYTLNGAVVSQPNDSNGVVNYASGGFTTDTGTPVAVTIPVGFKARKVRVINITSSATLTEWEYADQMPATTTVKRVGSTGVTTVDTGSAIVINDDSGNLGNGRSFTLSATLMTTTGTIAGTYVWEAFA